MLRRALTEATVEAIHDQAIELSGGLLGARDYKVLREVVLRARLDYVRSPSPFAPAAAYCGGIVTRRPLNDGHRRTGYLAAHVFLAFNGWPLLPEEAELAAVTGLFADGTLDEEMLTFWLEDCAGWKRAKGLRSAGGQTSGSGASLALAVPENAGVRQGRNREAEVPPP